MPRKPKADPEESQREAHMAYVMAFRKGVSAGFIPEGWSTSRLKPILDRGLADGRAAMAKADARELRRLGVSDRERQTWFLR